MFTETQARVMLRLQAHINARVNPQWIQAHYPYLRAVVVEAAEAMEHHGWKWWKKQQRDMTQLQMELVDIWHFILSHVLLANEGDEGRSWRQLAAWDPQDRDLEFDGRHWEVDALDFIAKLEITAGLAAARRFSLSLFDSLLRDCGMDWRDLYRRYVGKNVLNIFRQDHGYKEGRYRKNWNGREDNEHLVEAMAELDDAAPDFQRNLYQALKVRYRRVL